jgi:hypothetical protein
LTTSLLFILSNIPSHPITIKSKFFYNLNDLISGSHTITFGLPPYLGLLASISPNVLDTESLPGKTLNGPYT